MLSLKQANYAHSTFCLLSRIIFSRTPAMHMKLRKMTDSCDQDTFLYFAFGSNLLSQRIHINNPSATKVDVGKLRNFKLDFSNEGKRWKGAVANIIESPDEHVYGVLWRIHNDDMKNLDSQEGVDCGMYQPLQIVVDTEFHGEQKARSYQLVTPDKSHNKPSYVYLNVIVQGAIENKLPQAYIEQLKSIEHNNYKGEVDVDLDYSKIDKEF